MAEKIENPQPEGKKNGKAIDIQGLDVSREGAPVSIEQLGIKRQGKQVETDAAKNPKDT